MLSPMKSSTLSPGQGVHNVHKAKHRPTPTAGTRAVACTRGTAAEPLASPPARYARCGCARGRVHSAVMTAVTTSATLPSATMFSIHHGIGDPSIWPSQHGGVSGQLRRSTHCHGGLSAPTHPKVLDTGIGAESAAASHCCRHRQQNRPGWPASRCADARRNSGSRSGRGHTTLRVHVVCLSFRECISLCP